MWLVYNLINQICQNRGNIESKELMNLTNVRPRFGTEGLITDANVMDACAKKINQLKLDLNE